MNLSFRSVPASDIQAAFELEIAGFPADEAATLTSLQYRQSVAPSLFFGAYLTSTSQLIGFTCATLTPSSILTHESMSNHVPNSAYIGIHSVCVDGNYRRKGVAVSLMKAYLNKLETEGLYKGARLITHKELIPLYEKCGFKFNGTSEVIHGALPWFEMVADFTATEVEVVEKVVELPVVVDRNPGKTWESYGGSMKELVNDEFKNTADLYCPRSECRCLLLKAGVGKWVRNHSSDFELPKLPQPISTAPTSSTSNGYWSIPSPLSFENIGFSRNALPPTSTSTSISSTPVAANIKYLICADCDQGPLGWHDTEGRDLGLEVEAENEGKEGELRKGREFLLDVGRVRYLIK